MHFADYAKVYAKAGKGGAGMAHFRREKFVPKGGPDGGDGGRGGDVIVRGNSQMSTLLDQRYRKFVNAPTGKRGGTSRKNGKDAEPEILEVPLGTVVFEEGSRRRLGEITEGGQELVIARGGKGGLGNWHFKSPTNQTPQHAQGGEEGEEVVIELELKLIADVGLVGFPNAGKSTLLSALSAAKPQVADYPFTTLQPNLGVVTTSDYRSFVMADIPGIIEDAHEGKGLGIQFLRHIERNNLLLFVISCETDIEYEYRTLLNELKAYRKDLLEKPRLLTITKMDLIEDFDTSDIPEMDIPTVTISSATQHNLDTLKEEIWKLLETLQDEA